MKGPVEEAETLATEPTVVVPPVEKGAKVTEEEEEAPRRAGRKTAPTPKTETPKPTRSKRTKPDVDVEVSVFGGCLHRAELYDLILIVN